MLFAANADVVFPLSTFEYPFYKLQCADRNYVRGSDRHRSRPCLSHRIFQLARLAEGRLNCTNKYRLVASRIEDCVRRSPKVKTIFSSPYNPRQSSIEQMAYTPITPPGYSLRVSARRASLRSRTVVNSSSTSRERREQNFITLGIGLAHIKTSVLGRFQTDEVQDDTANNLQ